MNIGLLLCDDVSSPLRPIAGGYQEMFEALLRPHLPALEFTRYEVREGEVPASTDAHDVYLCTGSRHSVYDRLDWIEALKAFVRDVHDSGKAFVGICFGHQVLAEALGGRVGKAEQGWGIGVLEMSIVQPEPWMDPPQPSCRLQYMHGDQVQRLPPGGTLLAVAAHCPVAMFTVRETMLGIEGHPEFPAEYERALLESRRDRIGAAPVDAALASLSTPTDHALAGRWIARFIEQAKASI
jgi:GMP synthase-like glutamine amidotransferase